MSLSRRIQYALRAVLEVARHQAEGRPLRMREIAQRQCIPLRFLELILSELKHGGFVASVRGRHGGYVLARPARQITVGEVMACMGWRALPVDCRGDGPRGVCRLKGRCAFFTLWEDVRQALSSVCDRTTFQDLLEQERVGPPARARACPA